MIHISVAALLLLISTILHSIKHYKKDYVYVLNTLVVALVFFILWEFIYWAAKGIEYLIKMI